MKNKVVGIRVTDIYQLSTLIQQFSDQADKKRVDIPAQVSFDLYQNEIALSKAYYECERKRAELLKEYAVCSNDGEVTYYTPPATENNPSPIETIQFKSDQSRRDYLQAMSEQSLSEKNVKLTPFYNIQKRMVNTKGNHQVLSLLWSISDYINSACKKTS